MTKKIKIPAKRGPKHQVIKHLDDWVARGKKTPGKPGTFRFTIDLPIDLHRKMKIACAQHGLKMRDIVLGLLAREFPPDSPEAETPLPSTNPGGALPLGEGITPNLDKF